MNSVEEAVAFVYQTTGVEPRADYLNRWRLYTYIMFSKLPQIFEYNHHNSPNVRFKLDGTEVLNIMTDAQLIGFANKLKLAIVFQ